MLTKNYKEEAKMMKEKLTKMLLSFAVCFFLLIVAGPASVWADSYPSRSIKAFYGYAAGGTCYISFQALCKEAEKILKQPLVLVEKSGATATICGGTVARSNPDGYTIGVVKSTTIVNAPYQYKLPYSPMDDLTHIYAYSSPAAGFTVKKDYPLNTWKELIEYARKNPGKVSWASSGAMGNVPLITEYIGKIEGIQWNHVPCKGGAEAMKLLLGGQVDGYASSGSHVIHIAAGRAKLLADYMDTRTYPDVPTLEELGYEGLAIGKAPYIVIGPKNLPPNIRKTLEDAFEKASKSPAYLEVEKRLEMRSVGLKGKELEDFLKNTKVTIEKILKELNRI
jgi:tripartite-type tricarboxylate transporter receptor subunit TctC